MDSEYKCELVKMFWGIGYGWFVFFAILALIVFERRWRDCSYDSWWLTLIEIVFIAGIGIFAFLVITDYPLSVIEKKVIEVDRKTVIEEISRKNIYSIGVDSKINGEGELGILTGEFVIQTS